MREETNQPEKPKKIPVRTINQIIPNWKKYELSISEARFLAYYITNGRDKNKAYMDANPHKKLTKGSLHVTASRVLHSIKVQKVLDAHMDQFLRNKALIQKFVLDAYMDMASFDPASIVDEKGGLKYETLEDVPLNIRRCIQDIDTKRYGKDGDHRVTNIKLADRKHALEKLAEYSGMIKGNTTDVNISEDTIKLLSKTFKGVV